MWREMLHQSGFGHVGVPVVGIAFVDFSHAFAGFTNVFLRDLQSGKIAPQFFQSATQRRGVGDVTAQNEYSCEAVIDNIT